MTTAARLRDLLAGCTLSAASLFAAPAHAEPSTPIVAPSSTAAPEAAPAPSSAAAASKPVADKCCDDCAACGSCCKHKRPLEPTDVLGLRVSLTSVSGSDANGTSVGVTFAGGSEQYGMGDIWTARLSSIYAIGGGSGGLEGALGFAGTFGVRAPLGEHHGPFVRIGFGGEMLGNSKLYYSHIELPIGEAGYTYVDGRTVFELGARGAPILTGRYDTGNGGVRQLSGNFEWGGYAAAHTTFGRLDGSLLRVEARNTGSGGPVDIARATLCGYAGRIVAICADGMLLHGDVQYGTPEVTSSSTSRYGGVLVGFVNL